MGNFFALVLFKLHLHHFSKIKSHKEVTKQQESKCYRYLLFCLMIEGSGSRRPKKHTGPPDPDPQHLHSEALCFSGSAAVDAPLQEMLDYILRYGTVVVD
jgi:hypothetical protein